MGSSQLPHAPKFYQVGIQVANSPVAVVGLSLRGRLVASGGDAAGETATDLFNQLKAEKSPGSDGMG